MGRERKNDRGLSCTILGKTYKNKTSFMQENKVDYSTFMNIYKKANCTYGDEFDKLMSSFLNTRIPKDGVDFLGIHFKYKSLLAKALGFTKKQGYRYFDACDKYKVSYDKFFLDVFDINMNAFNENIKDGGSRKVLTEKDIALISDIGKKVSSEVYGHPFMMLEGKTYYSVSELMLFYGDYVKNMYIYLNNDKEKLKEYILEEVRVDNLINKYVTDGKNYAVIDERPYSKRAEGSKRLRCSYRGKRYNSCRELSRDIGISSKKLLSIIEKSISDGTDIGEDIDRYMERFKVTILGKQYDSVAKASEEIGVHQMILKSIKDNSGGLGEEFDRNLLHYINTRNKKKIYYRGKIFNSLADFARHYNISTKALPRLVRRELGFDIGINDWLDMESEEDKERILSEVLEKWNKRCFKDSVIGVHNWNDTIKSLHYKYSDDTGMCYFLVEFYNGTCDYLSNREILDMCNVNK